MIFLRPMLRILWKSTAGHLKRKTHPMLSVMIRNLFLNRGRLSSVSGSEKGVLVPVGGGKDSAVTLELLKGAGVPVYAYIINSRGATIHTTEAAGLDEDHVIYVKRTLDQNMLELNRQGYLNGHTPFSALVAFSGIMAARMAGLSYVALSNESSANESTVKGSTVNHQYSKSFKFEEDFHRYEAELSSRKRVLFQYAAPLKRVSDLPAFFAQQKQYHAIFRSCNAGSQNRQLVRTLPQVPLCISDPVPVPFGGRGGEGFRKKYAAG